MTEAGPDVFNKQVYLRLIALWVVCEAFAGGILHGFKIPFTGLGVSSLSVVCIVLIGYFVPGKRMILKATVIVAIFKLMLSPHAAPTAYIALFFQGLLGQILITKKNITRGAIILGFLALVESAIQRILVLLILYGATFWNAVDAFLTKLFGAGNITSYSSFLAIIYIVIHGITGIAVGRYASAVAVKAGRWHVEGELIIPRTNLESVISRRKKFKWQFLIVWAILLLFYIQQYLPGGIIVLRKDSAAQIFLRSLIIIITWVAVISPLLIMWLKKRLYSSKSKYEKEILVVMELIPQTRYILQQSWLNARNAGAGRWRLFLKQLLVNILYIR